MQSLLFCVLALLALLSPTSSYQCNPANREYVCFVFNYCIVGNAIYSEGDKRIVQFDSRTQQLKEGKCDVLIRLRNINNRRWFISIEAKEMEEVSLQQGQNAPVDPEQLANYRGPTELFVCDYESEVLNGTLKRVYSEISRDKRYCSSIVEPPTASEDMYTYLQNLPKEFISGDLRHEEGLVRQLSLASELKTVDVSTLHKQIALTHGCNPWQITVITTDTAPVPQGELTDVSTLLVGRGAQIDCMEVGADRLFIKRPSDAEFKQVFKVFCPEDVWAIQEKENDPKRDYLGSEPFELKCERNYCQYCGEIAHPGSGKRIVYEQCVPQCKNNLWIIGNSVVESAIKCKRNENDKDGAGAWTVEINGVDHAVTMAACYDGPWPIPPKDAKAIENSSSEFPRRIALAALILLAALN